MTGADDSAELASRSSDPAGPDARSRDLAGRGRSDREPDRARRRRPLRRAHRNRGRPPAWTSAFSTPCDVRRSRGARRRDRSGRDRARRAACHCRFAFHLSGALGSEALAPLRDAGRRGRLAPSRCAPSPAPTEEDWRDAFVAVEGDAAAADAGERIARAVGARPYRARRGESTPCTTPPRRSRPAATAAVVAIAVRAWVAAGIPEDVARETLGGLAARATAAVASRGPSPRRSREPSHGATRAPSAAHVAALAARSRRARALPRARRRDPATAPTGRPGARTRSATSCTVEKRGA